MSPSGEFCEKKIPYCTKEFNPCENGAVCSDHGSHYTCACPKGYSGQNCTVNADDCINHMCQVCGLYKTRLKMYREKVYYRVI